MEEKSEDSFKSISDNFESLKERSTFSPLHNKKDVKKDIQVVKASAEKIAENPISPTRAPFTAESDARKSLETIEEES